MSTYKDGLIECSDSEVIVHRYYLPVGGVTRVPYSSIQSTERFTLSARRGKARIWGSGDFRHWANFDVRRPTKSVGFILNVGRRLLPFLTPDDPDAFEEALRSHDIPTASS